MKKKILAGVLALMMAMGAVAVPSDVLEEMLDATSISASAADPSVTVEGMCKVTVNATKKLVTITAEQNYFSKSDSTINFDFSAAKTALDEEGIEYDGYEVLLNASFKLANYPNLSNIHFVDNFVTSIGNSMFTGMTNLQTVSFSDSITKLGTSVFSGCTNFAGSTSNNVLDLNNITNIGASAFLGCSTLVGIDFSENTTVIGNSAFQNCSKLKNVTIPSSVTSIGNGAFQNCTGLTDLTFANNSSLTIMGQNAFSTCSSLENVTADGVKNTLPHSLTSVSSGTFTNCKALKSFVIPKTLTAVSDQMFNGCSGLGSVTFEENSLCYSIGISAFANCSGLTGISLPDRTVEIDSGAFLNCVALSAVEVSDGLADLGKSAFAGCFVLSINPRSKANVTNKIILPDSVTSLPNNCFENDTNVTAVDLNKVSSIGEAAFKSCIALKSVSIPQAVTVINKSTFEECNALTTVDYSSSLTTILDKAFYNCSSLSKFTPYGTSSYEGAMHFTAELGGVQNSSFYGCKSVKYLNFLKRANGTSNFAIVGQSAFEGCTAIRGSNNDGITSNTIQFPKGVVVVQPRAFYNCSSLDTIVFDGNVTSLNDNAFMNCTNLTTVKMNPTITSLGKYVFNGCKNLLDLPVTLDGKSSALTQVDLIRDYSFAGCESLTKITIPANITAIGTNAFQKCIGLTNVKLDSSAKLTTIGNYAFDSCEKLVTFSTGTGTASVFPASVNAIGDNAFNKTAMTSISFPTPSNTSAVMTMGKNAFAANAALTTADLSKTNLSITGESMFNKCTALTSVKLPTTLSAISLSTFSDCNKLSTINSTVKGTYDIPANVKTIGITAFSNNYCLSTMKIPAKTDDISLSAWNSTLTYTQEDLDSGKYNPLKAFVVDSNNQKFKSVDGVLFNKAGTELNIYPHAKTDTSYTVPSTVKQITSSAFSSNKKLTKVTLNENLESIAAKAFSQCTNLKNVVFGANATVTLTQGCFVGMTTANPLYFSGKANSTAKTYADAVAGIYFVDNDLEAASISIAQGTSQSVALTKKTLQLDTVMTTKGGKPATDIVKWTTTDTAIAAVNDSGLVTLKKAGDATITVTTSTGLKASIKLHIGTEFSESTVKVALSTTSYVYTGSKVTPEPTVTLVKDGKALVKDTDYTVTYANNVNKGTATMTVTGIGTYAGVITKEFTISDKLADNDIGGATITNATAQSYLGIEITPIINVTLNGRLLLKGRDYTVDYKDNVKIGTASYTVTGKGKYIGTVTKNFEIKARANSTVKAPRIIGRQTTPYAGVVSWVPDFSVNGTEVVYAYDNNFTNSKTVTVEGYGVNTAAINSLKGDKKNGYDNTKTLYVKIRSFIVVNGTKTYGSWSDVRTIAPLKK